MPERTDGRSDGWMDGWTNEPKKTTKKAPPQKNKIHSSLVVSVSFLAAFIIMVMGHIHHHAYCIVNRHRHRYRQPRLHLFMSHLFTSFSPLTRPILPYPTLPYPTLPYPTLPYPSSNHSQKQKQKLTSGLSPPTKPEEKRKNNLRDIPTCLYMYLRDLRDLITAQREMKELKQIFLPSFPPPYE